MAYTLRWEHWQSWGLPGTSTEGLGFLGTGIHTEMGGRGGGGGWRGGGQQRGLPGTLTEGLFFGGTGIHTEMGGRAVEGFAWNINRGPVFWRYWHTYYVLFS